MYQVCEFCGTVDYFEYDDDVGEMFCAVCGAHVEIEMFVEELDG